MRAFLAVITLALLTGCGGQADTGTPEPSGSSESSGSETPSPTPSNSLTGSWAEQTGQADRIQQTWSGAGYECTRHGVSHLDLRMCVKSTAAPGVSRPGASARIRFLSDGKGTVVRAAVDSTNDTEGRALRKQMLTALLPAPDVAVVEAGGAKLIWGSAAEQGGVRHLAVKGGETTRRAVSHRTPETTKEKTLPLLQAAGLNCRFEDDQMNLERTAPDRSDKVRGSASVRDQGLGLAGLTVKALHGKTPENVAKVKALVPQVFSISPELADVRKWVEGHLDGREHSAYVGDFVVTVQVGLSPMFGDSVVVHVADEKDDLGASGK